MPVHGDERSVLHLCGALSVLVMACEPPVRLGFDLSEQISVVDAGVDDVSNGHDPR